MKRSDVVIVANTLPVRRLKDKAGEGWTRSPGGLVSALAPIAREENGAWVGWTGEVGTEREPFTHEGIWNIPVQISRAERDESYEGVCNCTLCIFCATLLRHSTVIVLRTGAV